MLVQCGKEATVEKLTTIVSTVVSCGPHWCPQGGDQPQFTLYSTSMIHSLILLLVCPTSQQVSWYVGITFGSSIPHHGEEGPG